MAVGKFQHRFVFPLTNSVAKENLPLACVCSARRFQIAERLLERDPSGDYVYNGIDPSHRISAACSMGHLDFLESLLKMKDGKYALLKMNSVDFTRVLLAAIKSKKMGMLQFLLKMEDGKYVLPGIRATEDMHTIIDQRPEITNHLEKRLGQ